MLGSNKSSSCLVHCNIGTFTPWGVILHMSLDCAFGCIERKDYTNNSHIDTKHDDLEHVYPFKYGQFRYVKFPGCTQCEKALKGTAKRHLKVFNPKRQFTQALSPHTFSIDTFPKPYQKKRKKRQKKNTGYLHTNTSPKKHHVVCWCYLTPCVFPLRRGMYVVQYCLAFSWRQLVGSLRIDTCRSTPQVMAVAAVASAFLRCLGGFSSLLGKMIPIDWLIFFKWVEPTKFLYQDQ